MATKIVSANTLQKGSYIVIEGAACKISDTQTSKPGKHGHSKMRIQAVGIIDGKKRDIVMPGHENCDVPIIEKRSAQVLSVSGDVANVMDSETFETFDLKIPEELKGSCVEGCAILYWDVLGERVMKQVKGGE